MSSKQAEKGNWDDFSNDESSPNNQQSERKRLPYVKFGEPGDYTFRLVGNHVKFLRYWQPFSLKDRVITHKDYRDDDPAWKAGFYPKLTYAIHVIDRADGQLKILEKGRSIFKEFAKYKAINDIDPAGKDGPDFVITVEIPKGNKRATKYNVTAKAKSAPFTPEEVAMIKEQHLPLTDMYKSTSLDKIKELWAALPDSAKIPPKKTKDSDEDDSGDQSVEQDTTPVNEPSPADEELFGGGDTETDSSQLF